MRIGELSKKTGVSERSLRHYEEKGVLPSKRLENGYRDFDESAIEKVELIQMYLQIGLNLEETDECCAALKSSHISTKSVQQYPCTLRRQTQ